MHNFRRFIPVALVLALTACGGSGGGIGNILGGNPQTGTECQTGTTEELASPLPNSTTSNVSQITIVANGNSNVLNQQPQNWYVYLIDNYGDQIQGGQLNPVSDTSGPHPYPSDFYYASQLPQTLPSGVTWTVNLTQYSGGCASIPLAGFST